MARRVITIAREFGSGGTRIAKKLAKELDIPVYDREILKLAAADSGIREELFAQLLVLDEDGSVGISGAIWNLKHIPRR